MILVLNRNIGESADCSLVYPALLAQTPAFPTDSILPSPPLSHSVSLTVSLRLCLSLQV